MTQTKPQIYLLLDNVRSMENVGSIFRTADAAGIDKVILCGITPKPPRKEIDKAALGAVDFVEWKYCNSTKSKIESLKQEGFEIIGIEQDKRSITYSNFKFDSAKIALILGSETDGINPEILDLCDQILEIPMYGQKNSLNVSVCAGIILFELKKVPPR
ncbi:MAG: RNA methyltransferase [Candidatus Berkelbacteria bacterium]|nr:RNA methyltransferase [Candidatus Berkelbacteria bacterium]